MSNDAMSNEVNELISVTLDAPVAPPEPPPEPPKPVEPPAPEHVPAPVAPEGVPSVPTEPPPTPPISSEAPPAVPVADVKDQEIAALRSTVDELRKLIETTASQVVAPVKTTPASVDTPPASLTFLEKEEDLDGALNSVENFNKLLTNVVKLTQESIVAAMPELTSGLVSQIVTQKLAVHEFYANNKDLQGNKAFVGMVANDLAAKNPTWNMENIIEKLGDEVRNRLRLGGFVPMGAAGVPNPVASSVETPAFVGGSNARPGGGTPPIDKLTAEIADLIADL